MNIFSFMENRQRGREEKRVRRMAELTIKFYTTYKMLPPGTNHIIQWLSEFPEWLLQFDLIVGAECPDILRLLSNADNECSDEGPDRSIHPACQDNEMLFG
jgi:hypothetical protein